MEILFVIMLTPQFLSKNWGTENVKNTIVVCINKLYYTIYNNKHIPMHKPQDVYSERQIHVQKISYA